MSIRLFILSFEEIWNLDCCYQKGTIYLNFPQKVSDNIEYNKYLFMTFQKLVMIIKNSSMSANLLMCKLESSLAKMLFTCVFFSASWNCIYNDFQYFYIYVLIIYFPVNKEYLVYEYVSTSPFLLFYQWPLFQLAWFELKMRRLCISSR